MTPQEDDRKEAGVVERESAAIRRLRERLVAGNGFAAADVEAAVDRAVTRLASATIREYVPLLAERLAVDDLRHTATTPERPLMSATEPGEKLPDVMEGQS